MTLSEIEEEREKVRATYLYRHYCQKYENKLTAERIAEMLTLLGEIPFAEDLEDRQGQVGLVVAFSWCRYSPARVAENIALRRRIS